MTYIRTNWTDEILIGAERFKILNNTNVAVSAWAELQNCQVQLVNVVDVAGTPLDASHLNNLEQGVVDANTGVGLSVKGRSASNTGDIADIVAGSDGYALRRSGTTLGFGQLLAAGLASNAVENAKIINGAVTPNKLEGSLADPAADRILFYDFSAGTFQWLTVGAGLTLSGTDLSIPAANNDTLLHFSLLSSVEALQVKDGVFYWTVPPELTGANLVSAQAYILSPSTSGTPTVRLSRGRRASPTSAVSVWDSMFSTNITIDANEYSSTDAAVQRVINTSYDDIVTRDVIRFDVTVAGTGAKGLDVSVVFRL